MTVELLENAAGLHTTKLGAERIKRNLKLEDNDPVQWCRDQISDRNAKVERIGKNWYVTVNGCRITIHASSNTIITAHIVKK